MFGVRSVFVDNRKVGVAIFDAGACGIDCPGIDDVIVLKMAARVRVCGGGHLVCPVLCDVFLHKMAAPMDRRRSGQGVIIEQFLAILLIYRVNHACIRFGVGSAGGVVACRPVYALFDADCAMCAAGLSLAGLQVPACCLLLF